MLQPGWTWGHSAKWYKPVTKRQILYDSTYIYEVARVYKFIETESKMYWGKGEMGNY